MTTASDNPKPVTAYCRACGKPLTEDSAHIAQGTVFCEEHAPAAARPATEFESPYAAPAGPAVANPAVSPGLAFVLGLLPGVGAIYNGQYAKGVVHVIILGLLISIQSSGAAGGLEPLFGMLIAVFWFYMAFEAYHTARKRMLGEPVEEFSSLLSLDPRRGASPLVPAGLILLGVIFLLNNLGVLYIGQILRWWPVLLIAAGAWMFYVRLRGSGPAKVEEDV
jgi:hypothetical protein